MSGSGLNLWRAFAVSILFFVGGLLAVVETRFDGGFAFIWVSSPVLLAYLMHTPRREWLFGLSACGIASVLVTAGFGLGWSAALPLLLANMVESVGAALLLQKWKKDEDSVAVLMRFVVATCGAAALAAALIAGTTLYWLNGTPVVSGAINWYTGHCLGFLTFTPIFGLLWSGEITKRWQAASSKQLLESALLSTLVAGTCVGVFAQTLLPLLFLPFLPIILMTFRSGRLGAGVAVTLLAVAAAIFTSLGRGPISLIDADVGTRIRFLQFYVAAVALTILPVAIELARRTKLSRDLVESEARYRTLADHSTDIIMNLDVNGVIRFVSPAIQQLAGYDPSGLIGRQCLDLIDPEHRAAVAGTHLRALQGCGRAFKIEYVGVLADGSQAWFETHTRAVLDAEARVTGAVSMIRDIAERKALEASLVEAATIDSLTGVLNRRGFMRELGDAVASSDHSSLALFDLDHFKQINDRFGHDGGDEVLRSFAKIASDAVRRGDVVGRLGGEEFAVLLRDTTPDAARIICERLRANVAKMICTSAGRSIHVTVSGGVAAVSGDAALSLSRADEALYRAKNSGRDRLALAA